jgi:hypothetical protein
MLSEKDIAGQNFAREPDGSLRIGAARFEECKLAHQWPQNDPRHCDLCFCGFEADPWETPEEFQLTRTLYTNGRDEFLCSDCVRKFFGAAS